MKTSMSIGHGWLSGATFMLLASALCSCVQENVAPLIEEPRYGLYGTVMDSSGRPLDSVRVFCLFSYWFPPEVKGSRFGLTRLSDIDTFSFRLYQNFPNPFSQSTYLRFSLPRYCDIRLTIADRLDGSVKYVYTETLLPGFYQMYLHRLVDSLRLRNGPYTYTLWVNIGQGIHYQATRQMFVISDSGMPNSVSNVRGQYFFDYREAFIGDSVWYSYNGEDVYPYRLYNSVTLLVQRRGYVRRTFLVDIYPTILLRRDIVLIREIRED